MQYADYRYRRNKLCCGHGMPPTAVTSVERFHINHVASAIRSLICLVTLTLQVMAIVGDTGLRTSSVQCTNFEVC